MDSNRLTYRQEPSRRWKLKEYAGSVFTLFDLIMEKKRLANDDLDVLSDAVLQID